MNIIREYIVEMESDGKSDETVSAFINTIQVFMRWKLNNTNIFVDNVDNNDIIKLRPTDMRQYKIHMSKIYKKSGANTKLRYLKAFWTWVMQMGYSDEDIFKGVKNFEEPNRKPISMEIQEVVTLLDHVGSLKAKHGKRDYVILSVLVASGLRISEALNLTPDMIMVERYEEGDSYTLDVVGKGDKQRETILTSGVYEDLMRYIIKNDIEKDEKIFKVSVRTVERNLQKYLDSTGLNSKYTPHKLRHTFATLLYENGVQIEEISTYLGHANTTTTTKSYVNISGKQMRKASKLHPMSEFRA